MVNWTADEIRAGLLTLATVALICSTWNNNPVTVSRWLRVAVLLVMLALWTIPAAGKIAP